MLDPSKSQNCSVLKKNSNNYRDKKMQVYLEIEKEVDSKIVQVEVIVSYSYEDNEYCLERYSYETDSNLSIDDDKEIDDYLEEYLINYDIDEGCDFDTLREKQIYNYN